MKKVISLILLIGWMVLIFILSNQTKTVSDNTSGEFVVIFNKVTSTNNDMDALNYIVRKIAHITEYLVLYLLMYNYIRFYSKNPVKLSILFTLIYACIDETHQLFIDGRTGNPFDILVDSIGIMIGYLIEVTYEKKIKERSSIRN